MRIRIIISQLLITSVGISALGCSNNTSKECVNPPCKITKPISINTSLSASKILPDPPKASFNIRHDYFNSITKDELIKVRRLDDIIPDYPTNWIEQYESVDISITTNGEEKIVTSKNNILTKEQLDEFKKADFGVKIFIQIHYKTANSATGLMDNRTAKHGITVTPIIEAKYPEGFDSLLKHFKEKSEGKIPEKILKDFKKPTIIVFTINEKGNSDNVRIKKSSGDTKTDELLMKMVKEMPTWIPAQDKKGVLRKQDFQLSLGMGC